MAQRLVPLLLPAIRLETSKWFHSPDKIHCFPRQKCSIEPEYRLLPRRRREYFRVGRTAMIYIFILSDLVARLGKERPLKQSSPFYFLPPLAGISPFCTWRPDLCNMFPQVAIFIRQRSFSVDFPSFLQAAWEYHILTVMINKTFKNKSKRFCQPGESNPRWVDF